MSAIQDYEGMSEVIDDTEQWSVQPVKASFFRPEFVPLSSERERHEDGGSAIEFALCFMLFALVTFGIMEFGRAVWSYTTISHAAREGTRYASVRGVASGRPASETEIAAFVQSRAVGVGPLVVTTSWDPDKEPGSVVQVKVQYDFQFWMTLVGTYPIRMSSTSRIVISQ